MLYNNQKTASGNVMPLLMGCTAPSPVKTGEVEHKIIYDPMTQKVVMDMRVVGTRSLKHSYTRIDPRHGKGDDKNEIDDRKNV